MEDFSNPAVQCFVDSLYSGEVDLLEREIFEEVNKMAHVFGVKWLSKKCLKFFQSDILNFATSTFDEILFACEIARRAHCNLKQAKFVSLFVRNMTSRNIGKKAFLRIYMANFTELSRRQINMSIEIAKNDLDIIFDCLLSYLSFGLKCTGFDENSLYLLQNLDIRKFRLRHPDQFSEVANLITELSEGSESSEVKEVVGKFVRLSSEDVA